MGADHLPPWRRLVVHDLRRAEQQRPLPVVHERREIDAPLRRRRRLRLPPHAGWAQSRCRCGRGEPSPGAEVAAGEPSRGADVAAGEPSSGADVAAGGPSPGADVAMMSRVPAQMWQGRAQFRCRCGRGEPSPGADVAAAQHDNALTRRNYRRNDRIGCWMLDAAHAACCMLHMLHVAPRSSRTPDLRRAAARTRP